MLLLVASLAQATEIGTSKLMGWGVNTGTSLEATGKVWFDTRSGVAFFGGLNWWRYLDVRGQYERDLFAIADLSWAELSMTVHGGLQLDVFPVTDTGKAGIGLGPYAGAQGRLLFHDMPLELFTGPDLGARWVTYTQVRPVQPIVHWNIGGRWYF